MRYPLKSPKTVLTSSFVFVSSNCSMSIEDVLPAPRGVSSNPKLSLLFLDFIHDILSSNLFSLMVPNLTTLSTPNLRPSSTDGGSSLRAKVQYPSKHHLGTSYSFPSSIRVIGLLSLRSTFSEFMALVRMFRKDHMCESRRTDVHWGIVSVTGSLSHLHVNRRRYLVGCC